MLPEDPNTKIDIIEKAAEKLAMIVIQQIEFNKLKVVKKEKNKAIAKPTYGRRNRKSRKKE